MLRARLGASVPVDSRIGWARIVGAAGQPMRKEAGRALVPQLPVEPGEQRLVAGDDQQPLALVEQLAGDAGDDRRPAARRRAGRSRPAPAAPISPRPCRRYIGRAGARHSRSRPCRRSARLVRPGHAGDVEVRPGDAVVDEALEELRRGDRSGLARADVLHVGDLANRSAGHRPPPAAGATACRRSLRPP